MFIQTEATPNPATLKFLPGRVVMEDGTFEARDPAAADRSPLARALMELPGVTGVFFANDFISVTKGEGEWQHLRPAVLGVVTEFFLSGAPLIETGGADVVTTGEFFDAKDAETVEAIKELIETRVRPAVAGDGGDIIFKGFRDGIVVHAEAAGHQSLDQPGRRQFRQRRRDLAGGPAGGRGDRITGDLPRRERPEQQEGLPGRRAERLVGQVESGRDRGAVVAVQPQRVETAGPGQLRGQPGD